MPGRSGNDASGRRKGPSGRSYRSKAGLTLQPKKMRGRKPSSQRWLTRQLNELQEAGIVSRKDFKTIPPHVEYSLTPLGQSLIPLLRAMHDWAAAHADKLIGKK